MAILTLRPHWCAPECGSIRIGSIRGIASYRGGNGRLSGLIGESQRTNAGNGARLQPLFDHGFAVADAPLAKLDERGTTAVRSLALQGRTGRVEPFCEFFLAEDRVGYIVHCKALMKTVEGSVSITACTAAHG